MTLYDVIGRILIGLDGFGYNFAIEKHRDTRFEAYES